MISQGTLLPECTLPISAVFSKMSQTDRPVSTKPEANQVSYLPDFQKDCRDRTREIFLENAEQLLWPAIVITGNADLGFDCFTEALDQVSGTNSVFSEPAIAWAKRSVIRSAIRKMHPSLSAFACEDQTLAQKKDEGCDSLVLPTPESASVLLSHLTEADLLPALLDLDCLHRTVYLLRVLEGWTRVEAASMLQMPESRIEFAERNALVLFTDILLTKFGYKSDC